MSAAFALTASGCCCDVLVFIPIQEVSAASGPEAGRTVRRHDGAPPALSRSLVWDNARRAAD